MLYYSIIRNGEEIWRIATRKLHCREHSYKAGVVHFRRISRICRRGRSFNYINNNMYNVHCSIVHITRVLLLVYYRYNNIIIVMHYWLIYNIIVIYLFSFCFKNIINKSFGWLISRWLLVGIYIYQLQIYRRIRETRESILWLRLT